MKKTHINRLTRAAFAAVLLVYAYWKRTVLMSIGVVLLGALLLTCILAPLCLRLEKRGISAGGSAAISILLLLLVILLCVSLFVPYLVAQSVDLLERITPTVHAIWHAVERLIGPLGLNLQIVSGIGNMLTASMTKLTVYLARSGAILVRMVGMCVFSLVIAYYLLKDRRLLINLALLFLPVQRRNVCISAVDACKNALLGYLSGIMKTSVFISVCMFAGLLLLGVKDALLLSIFMGIFEVLPYIGPVLASIPILLVALPQGAMHTWISLALILVVQQVESNIISPYFTASSTSIHPLTALLSVFVAGSLWGLWGILLAIPAVIVIRTLLWSLRET